MMRNTCSIDYFLMIIYIVYENNYKDLNGDCYDCFLKIHGNIKINDWNSARLEWLKFANLQNYVVSGNTHDWFASEFQSYYSSYSIFQKYSWTFKCSKGPSCKNFNRCESSTSFILK